MDGVIATEMATVISVAVDMPAEEAIIRSRCIVSKCTICMIITNVLFLIALGLVVGLSYIATDQDIKKSDCVIISCTIAQENIENPQFRDALTGRKRGGNDDGTYYTIDVVVAPHYYNGDPKYEYAFKDGYRDINKRNRIYRSIVVNETSMDCWYRPSNPEEIRFFRSGFLKSQSWGVAVMTIACATTLVLLRLCAWIDD